VPVDVDGWAETFGKHDLPSCCKWIARHNVAAWLLELQGDFACLLDASPCTCLLGRADALVCSCWIGFRWLCCQWHWYELEVGVARWPHYFCIVYRNLSIMNSSMSIVYSQPWRWHPCHSDPKLFRKRLNALRMHLGACPGVAALLDWTPTAALSLSCCQALRCVVLCLSNTLEYGSWSMWGWEQWRALVPIPWCGVPRSASAASREGEFFLIGAPQRGPSIFRLGQAQSMVLDHVR